MALKTPPVDLDGDVAKVMAERAPLAKRLHKWAMHLMRLALA